MDKEHILMQEHEKKKKIKIKKEKKNLQKINKTRQTKSGIRKYKQLEEKILRQEVIYYRKKNYLLKKYKPYDFNRAFLYKRAKPAARKKRHFLFLQHRRYVLSNLVRLRIMINRWRRKFRVRKQTYRFFKKQLRQYYKKKHQQHPRFYHPYIRKIIWELEKKRKNIIALRKKLLLKNIKYKPLPVVRRFYRFRHSDHRGCIIMMRATRNNFIVTAVNKKGEVLSSYNAGKCGYKGKKKRLIYTAEECASQMATFLKKSKIPVITLIVKSKIRRKLKDAFKKLKINNVKERRIFTRVPVPHNGIRGRKLPRK